ncbi:MAG: hypothetical protein HW421_1824 [Ignavibacteria bacterium]|nr:hypothetical protein [Ignavibacteria bacterium]
MADLKLLNTELPAGSNKPIKFIINLTVHIDNITTADPGILEITNPNGGISALIPYAGAATSHVIQYEVILNTFNNNNSADIEVDITV